LQSELDARGGAGDLAGDEGFATDGGFVIEENAIAGIDAGQSHNDALKNRGLYKAMEVFP
jgi:hypothetical protein